MIKIWTWICNKFGRLISSLGIVLSGVETLDISAIKDPLEGLMGHKGVMAVTVALFVASYLRHQYVSSLHPVTPPTPETQR